jgi:mono/diheme cytochrome c family protein
MIRRRLGPFILALLALPPAVSFPAETDPSGNVERGRMLYENACGVCHTTQAHWREKHLVHSWDELVYQVKRWQGMAGQAWSGAEVNDVASYLNDRFYHLQRPDREQRNSG